VVRRLAHLTYRHARRIAIAVVGGSVLLVGVAMLVLPGPAIVVIPLGLGILSVEFAWARHWLHQIRDRANSVLGNRSARSDERELPRPRRESEYP
jgi:tellurite resistance protein TerC